MLHRVLDGRTWPGSHLITITIIAQRYFIRHAPKDQTLQRLLGWGCHGAARMRLSARGLSRCSCRKHVLGPAPKVRMCDFNPKLSGLVRVGAGIFGAQSKKKEGGQASALAGFYRGHVFDGIAVRRVSWAMDAHVGGVFAVRFGWELWRVRLMCSETEAGGQ